MKIYGGEDRNGVSVVFYNKKEKWSELDIYLFLKRLFDTDSRIFGSWKLFNSSIDTIETRKRLDVLIEHLNLEFIPEKTDVIKPHMREKKKKVGG
jgi:hypothetical protein